MTGIRRLILLAAWFALLTALGELAVRAVEAFALGRYLYLARQILWMTPLADLVVFGAVALVLGLFSLAWRPAAGIRVAATMMGGVAAMSALSLQPWMAWWAMLPLAGGIAFQVGRIAGEHEAAAMRLVRRSLPVVAGVTVLLGGGEALGSALVERRALAALPPPATGTPNVLVIVWDAVRSDALSLYGYGRPTTPRLSAFASGGVAFERAFSTASYTSPTHASLFTGQWPHRLTTTWQIPLDGTTPTLAETLARRGYRTAGFSANHLLVTWETGLLRGFSHGEDYVASIGEVARSSGLLKWILHFDALRVLARTPDVPGRRPARDIRTSFVSWLDGGEQSRPFFAFLNMYDAHDPYLPPAPFDTLFGWPAGAGPETRRRVRAQSIADKMTLSAAEHVQQRALYDGAIASMDHELGLLLDTLRRRGVLQNTLVVMLSDHGEAFGEHGPFTHGNNAYVEEIHVPLVMVLDGRLPAGARVPGVVSVRDVPATIGEILGVAGPSWPLPGRSLARFWRDRDTLAAPRFDTVLAEVDRLPRGGNPSDAVVRGNVRSIIAWPYHLIATGPALELFDLASDPGQRRNLSDLPEHRSTRDSLVAALHLWRRDAVPSKR